MDEAGLELPRPIASYASREMASTSSCQTDGEWINDVRARVNLVQSMDHPEGPCTIFRVPKHIRQLDCKAYEPLIASLGPFHHGSPGTYFMECHKWQCIRHLLSRHPSPERASQLLNECLLELKKHDKKVRSCYSEDFSRLSPQDMALIMLLDGCFIIYLMLIMCPRKESLIKKERTKEKGIAKEIEVGKLEGEARGEVVLNIDEKDELLDSPTVAGLFTMDVVVYDLLKLENQIPFFIIQLLFYHLKACEDGPNNLVDLALRLFEGIRPEESKSFEKKSPGEYHHLLHLFYSSRIPSKKPVESTSALGKAAPSQGASTSAPTSKSIPGCIELVKWRKADPPRRSPTTAPKWFPSATELDRAGIKFEKKKEADSFLNIKFQERKIPSLLCLGKLFLMLRSGRMEIPPLQIYDYTGPLFRNLIAFEQCYFDTEMYITIYALFMDCIIDQAEDVQLLYLRGILEHGLSNDQAVADLINNLRSKIHHFWEKNYLLNQIDEVNNFYEVTRHKRVAALRRDYCGNPWATISVLAAAFLLLLTVEQAIFSAMSYVQPLQKG